MKPRTVIIGGGFAGRQACKALHGTDTDVWLIDPSPVTVMIPSLPDLAGGWIPERLIQRPLGELLPKTVTIVQKTVSLIDLDATRVVANGETFLYDHLLIAAGSVSDFHGMGGPRDLMHPLASLPDALRIQDDFASYLRETDRSHVFVSGGGYTGLELAMSLFYRARASGKDCRVTVVDPALQILPFLPDSKRQTLLDFLANLDVEIRLGTTVEKFDGRNVVSNGKTDENVFFCWAAGSTFAVPEIKGAIARLRDGRLKVRPDISLPNYPNVFAAGDAAAFERRGQMLRKAVNFAFHGGRHAGRNIARQLHGKPTRPFRPVDLGYVIPLHVASVGRLPGGLWVKGRLGVRLHYLMCGIRNYSIANFASCLKLAWKGKYT